LEEKTETGDAPLLGTSRRIPFEEKLRLAQTTKDNKLKPKKKLIARATKPIKAERCPRANFGSRFISSKKSEERTFQGG